MCHRTLTSLGQPKTHAGIALLAMASLAATASATVFNPNNYRLDLFLVLRDVNNNVLTDVQTGGVVNAVPGRTYRVELRYRIFDGDLLDNTGSLGLTASILTLRSSSLGGGTISKAPLSADQGARGELGIASGATPQNPDTSTPDNNLTLGLPELGPMRSGICDPFRVGVQNDSSLANGHVAIGGGWTFEPIALASSGQKSFDELVPNNQSSNTWALYAFQFTYQSGEHLITATPDADVNTGVAFAFWSGGVTPNQARNFTPANIRFVPSAPTASAFALLALSISRRRRPTVAE